MLRNSLLLFWRTVARQPWLSGLNLAGLTLGMAAALGILLYLDFELSYDRSHVHADRIYRIETRAIQTREKVLEVGWHSTPANLGSLAQQEYAGVAAYVRFFKYWKDDFMSFQYQDKTISEAQVYAADSSVFDVFSYEFVEGTSRKALDGPAKIVLSESLARRIFGPRQALGQTLRSNLSTTTQTDGQRLSLLVTGVYRDLPRNGHRVPEALISAQTDPDLDQYYFNQFNTATYLLLQPGVDPAALASDLSGLYTKYLNPEREPVLVSATHELLPLAAIHLAETGGYTYLYIFGAVGLLMLFLALISYVNLVTAQASKRALEIGVRKVMGSSRRQVAGQFLTESLAFTLLALVAGVALLSVSSGYLNEVLGLQLDARQLARPPLLAGMLALAVGLGTLGGSYPALVLSSLRPVVVLKGGLVKGATLRTVLVGVQFGVVLFVLGCTALIYDQLRYLQRKNLGFDQEQILRLSRPGEVEAEPWEVFKKQLRQSTYVVSAGSADFLPGTDDMVKGPISAEGTTGPEPQLVRRGRVDADFLSTMGIRLVAGRNFLPDAPADATRAAIINQTLARQFGLAEPLGAKIRLGDQGNPNYLEVVGVMEDFHQSSLHQPIEPQLLLLRPSDQLVVKVGEDLPKAMAQLESTWQRLFPQVPFTYRFLEEALQDGYRTDQLRGRIFLAFSFLTLFIAALGLFGLAAFIARQRAREIGIRKVLGAGLGPMVLLLTREYLLLIGGAALPAFGAAWYVVDQWLDNFAFRTAFNYPLLALVLLFTLLLTLLITGLHAWRTARRNPVSVLRSE
ncbi:ABC transporter permease [Rhabdobacter roseus]|uniref:Putative ABC transport system permease protein n=1 Tax=Rhabdobacter roseus TaxID=1655419 RepID=A0A840TRR1_9BACT|nr:ABC transporter permease [Rhabdobacter roseus]MBB5285605.1 putative ABC transport system permease protein [Rhabdobacter roseus]